MTPEELLEMYVDHHAPRDATPEERARQARDIWEQGRTGGIPDLGYMQMALIAWGTLPTQTCPQDPGRGQLYTVRTKLGAETLAWTGDSWITYRRLLRRDLQFTANPRVLECLFLAERGYLIVVDTDASPGDFIVYGGVRREILAVMRHSSAVAIQPIGLLIGHFSIKEGTEITIEHSPAKEP